MGTSRSTDFLHDCSGEASVFSGRPDPVLKIDDAVSARLKSLWSAMPPFMGTLPVSQPLGYRGCFLRCGSSAEWYAWGGVVTLKTSGREESRIDSERLFERLLLNSAPQGLLPKGMF
jgi:hypothetical protein